MLLVLLIRWAIFLTFILLVAEGVAAIIIVRRFYSYYVRKHMELELRIERIETRLATSKEQQQ